ncbi:MAG TPA: ABC transporter substrate-binding protein [Solirubrobacterales bacterium]|jgi:iron complex transport system substrate-binding protein|nr:ABC transporter substrate-binding protein [Solirubrobacterales bacterium]
MLFALGLDDQVVAVTHECDYPPQAASRPHLTRSIVPEGLAAGQIDAAVREAVGAGRALYELDEVVLRELDVDLIATQAVCEVCAVSSDDVRAVAARLPSRPEVVSLDPGSLDEVLADLPRLGEATGAAEAANALRARLDSRLDAVRERVAGAPAPRVLALEWLDPPFVGGHWIPEMITIAGGADAIGTAGAKSRTAGWEELRAAKPEVVVAMPCGWDSARARQEALGHWEELADLGAERVIAVDAAASFSRPGPRLVEGTELLAHLLHPDRVEPPDGVSFEEVRPHYLATR